MDLAIKSLYDDPSLLHEGVLQVADHASANTSVHSIRHMTGRMVTGIVLAPPRILAGVGDVPYGIEQGRTIVQQLLSDDAYGN